MTLPRSRFRRLFRFSLSFAILALTVCCVLLGFLARRVERQRAAVAAILKAGGRMSYEHSTAIGSRVHWDKPPNWLRRQLGEDWFSSVHGVTLYGDSCCDATLQHVKELPEVRRLALWAWATAPPADNPMGGTANTNQPLAGITDDGLVVLKSLRNLEHISFLGNQVSDAGIEQLHNHPRLRSLQLAPHSSKCSLEGIDKLLQSLGPGAANH
jgi:hypothetical protein